MLRRALTYAAVGLFAGSVAVWAADTPAAGETTAPAANGGEIKPAKSEAKTAEQKKSWIEENLETVQREMAGVEKQIAEATDTDVKGVGNEILATGKDMVDLLQQAQGAVVTGGKKAAAKYRPRIDEQRKSILTLLQKYALLAENARYKAMAAEATASADLKALVNAVVKANLDLIDLEIQTARKEAEKQQLAEQISQQQNKGRVIGPVKRVVVGKKNEGAAKSEATPPAATAPATTEQGAK